MEEQEAREKPTTKWKYWPEGGVMGQGLVGVVILVAPLAILECGCFALYAKAMSLQQELMITESRFPGKIDELACLSAEERRGKK